MTTHNQSRETSTLQGFNQTHLVNHVTDQKARIIPEAIQRLKDEIPQERRQVMRFPGGTEANFYNCTISSYSPQDSLNSKYARNNVNVLDLFIEVSKQMEWKVIPVLNLYEEYINPSLTAERERQNIMMIDKILDAGVEIAYIELGNELNIWLDKSKLRSADYNRDPENHNREIQRYYDISTKYYNLLKERYPNIKIAAVYADDNNARDRQWQKVFSQGKWEGLVVHLYEDDPESLWSPKIREIVESCKDVGKECLITEWAWKLGAGTNSPAYRANSRSPLLPKYHEQGWQLMEDNGVAVSCFHRISGIGGHLYNYVQF